MSPFFISNVINNVNARASRGATMTDTLPKTQIDEEITEAPVEHDSVLGKY